MYPWPFYLGTPTPSSSYHAEFFFFPLPLSQNTVTIGTLVSASLFFVVSRLCPGRVFGPPRIALLTPSDCFWVSVPVTVDPFFALLMPIYEMIVLPMRLQVSRTLPPICAGREFVHFGSPKSASDIRAQCLPVFPFAKGS